MRSTFIRLLVLLVAVSAFGQDFTNEDTDLKGSRQPSWSTDSGAANAYALTTMAPLGPSLRNGSCFKFVAAHPNTGASTVTIDGGSTISIKRYDGTTALSANDVSGLAEICYDSGGAVFRLSGPGALTFLNISGALGCAQLPGFTGDVANSACAMTVGALHLSPIPSLCSSGNYARGIDANGNATGCASAACFLSNGVNAQTSSYTLVSGDAGKLVTMNATSATATLPSSPPSSTWCARIQNLNSTSLTVSRNGLTINGGTTNITLAQYQTITCVTDNSNYFCTRPIAASTNITITETSDKESIASAGGGSGGWNLLESHTPSASPCTNVTECRFTSCLGSASYLEYKVTVDELTTTATASPGIFVSTNGGSTWDTNGSDYIWSGDRVSSNSTAGINGGNGFLDLDGYGGSGVEWIRMSGEITFFTNGVDLTYTSYMFAKYVGGDVLTMRNAGRTSNSGVNGFEFVESNYPSNTFSITARCYGISK